jgi:hypothetical protein
MLPLRFTWDDLANEPEYVATTVRQAIDLRTPESIAALGGR